MADLQYAAGLPGRIREQVSLGNRSRNRLFQQYVDPLTQQQTANARMLARRDRDACRVHTAAQRSSVGQDRSAKFVGDPPGALRIGIYDANQLYPFELAIDARVIPSKIAHPHNCHAHAPVRHPLFAPESPLRGASGLFAGASSLASGAKASTEIPASSAASMSRVRSKSKVR